MKKRIKKAIKQAAKRVISWGLRILGRRKNLVVKGAKYILAEATSPKPVSFTVDPMPPIKDFCLELSKYDIISFDIFDTLIFRAFPDPKTIFDIMGTKLKIQYGRKMRAEAEAEVRAEQKPREVTLDQIHERFSQKSGIDKEVSKQLEIDLELEFCKPNPYMRAVFDHAVKSGRTVIIVSDMYLPQKVIQRMLDKCGYTGYSKLYVSGECGVTKENGDMFQMLTDLYGRDKSYIHIGDNVKSDVRNAKRCGWSACQYPSVTQIGKPFRPDGMSSLGGGLYRGIVNTYLYNGLKKDSPYYDLGFVHFGLAIYGYCAFLENIARETSVDMILFAARDMKIVHKLYNKYFGAVPNAYIPISRLAILRADFQRSSEMFLTCLRDAYKNNPNTLTIGSYFSSVSFDFLLPLLAEYDLREDTVLNDSVYAALRKMIFEKKPYILEQLKQDHDAAVAYYSGLLQPVQPKKILFVDLNGRCTSAIGVQHILENAGFQTDVIAAQMYSVSSPGYVEIKMSDRTLYSYMFSVLQDQPYHQRFQTKALIRTRIIEAVFTEPRGTLLSYTGGDDGGLKFGSGSVNTDALSSIHQGIEDFADEFHHYSQKICKDFWVSPYDACNPMEQILDSAPDLFPDLMSDMTLGN